MSEEMEVGYEDGAEEMDTLPEGMERELTPQEHYEQAKQEIEMLKVVCQPRCKAELLRRAAQDMQMAGTYRNAPMLAERYQKKARMLRRRGKKALYNRACDMMNEAHTLSEQRYVLDMLWRLKSYRNAQELAQEFERKSRAEARSADIRNFLTAFAVILAVIALLILFR